jgi:hypothetical protein
MLEWRMQGSETGHCWRLDLGGLWPDVHTIGCIGFACRNPNLMARAMDAVPHAWMPVGTFKYLAHIYV